jgi:hypothetical protein
MNININESLSYIFTNPSHFSFTTSYLCSLNPLCVSLQVTMADRSAADRACKDPNPIIDGRKANVNLAYLGAKPRVMQPGKHTLTVT